MKINTNNSTNNEITLCAAMSSALQTILPMRITHGCVAKITWLIGYMSLTIITCATSIVGVECMASLPRSTGLALRGLAPHRALRQLV